MKFQNIMRKNKSLRLCTLAVPKKKFPPITPNRRWKQFQKQLPTDKEIEWMASQPETNGLCLLGGKISGQLFIRDFEGKDKNKNPMMSCFEEWKSRAKKTLSEHGIPSFIDEFLIHQTRNNGYHLFYRVDTQETLPTTDLAKNNNNVLIESRAEGAYVLIPPSPGYNNLQGSFETIPIISYGVHLVLLSVDHSFNHSSTSSHNFKNNGVAVSETSREEKGQSDFQRPGDIYNQQGDFRSVLIKHGWNCHGWQSANHKETEYWVRPGKKAEAGSSATFNSPECPNRFYVFSDNAPPFQAMTSYSPFAIYCFLEHRGNFREGAKALRQKQQSPTQKSNNKTEDKSNEHSLPLSSMENNTVKDSTLERHTIITNNRFMREITDDIHNAISERNKEKPFLFVRSGIPTRIVIDERNHATAQPLNTASCRNILDKTANFVHRKTKSDEEGTLKVSLRPIAPSETLAKNYLAEEKFQLPALTSITSFPTITAKGDLVIRPGYEKESQIFHHAAYPLEIGDLTPNDENIKWAKDTIITATLGDFPFVDNASLANTIAEMITPLVRQMITGPTPLFVHSSSTAGTGKSLLASACTLPFSVSGASIMTAGKDDDEWRKRITAKLITGTSHILIDNVQEKLTSGDLAAALSTPTNAYWEDRILGQSLIVRLPIRCVWIVTGNNIELSNEIARRTVWIRLDAKVERPWQRTGFKHNDLENWITSNRSNIITALLILVKNWQKQKHPLPKTKLGGYQAWTNIVGGILIANGIEGFLENAEELYDTIDTERDAWFNFVEVWAENWGAWSHEKKEWGAFYENTWHTRKPEEVQSSVGTKELFNIASHSEDPEETGLNILDSFLGQGNERARRNNLGRLLQKHKDRVFGKYQIQKLQKRVKRLAQFRLVVAKEGASSGASSNFDSPDTPPPEHSDTPDPTTNEHSEVYLGVSNPNPKEERNYNQTKDGGGINTPDTPNGNETRHKASDSTSFGDGASSSFRYTYHREQNITEFLGKWYNEKREMGEIDLRILATECFLDLTITPWGSTCSPEKGITQLLCELRNCGIEQFIISGPEEGWWAIDKMS